MMSDAAILSQKMSVEAFDAWVQRPENVEKNYEFIDGEVYEVVSEWNSSSIATIIMSFITQYVITHDLGGTSGADGGYIVNGQRYIPDGAFVSQARMTDERIAGYYVHAPDLALEVLSPTDQPHKIRQKMLNYLAAGTTLWLVDPAAKTVEVYAPGLSLLLGIEDSLDGGVLLPGFSLPVKSFLK